MSGLAALVAALSSGAAAAILALGRRSAESRLAVLRPPPPGPPRRDAREARSPRSDRVHRDRVESALPVAVDLLAAALRAGTPVNSALGTVAEAVGGPVGSELGAVAERLRLGADPSDAWPSAKGQTGLAELGRTLIRAGRTGAPVADVLDQFTADRRQANRARTAALAQRTGVLVVIPLGLCFLPAFVLIGVVPLAAGLLGEFALG